MENLTKHKERNEIDMKKPNIVFIFADQHNGSIMKNAGDKYINTPNLDKLAANGVKFNNCYCASPLCVPSRMSLLTGKLPINCGVYNNNQTLHSDYATFAHSTNIAGYETVLSGRMHFYGHDQYHGFEKRLVGDNTPLHHGYDILEANFGNLKTSVLQHPDGLTKSGKGSSAVYSFDNDVVAGTISYLENREDDRPLMMTVGLFAPHPPFVGDPERYDYYKSILPDAPVDQEFKDKLHPAVKQWLECRKVYDISEDHWRSMRAAYYSMVEFLDGNVGRIIDKVEETLGLDNTIIIYSSDHGEGLGINGIPWKGTFYEASAKVPLIISYPKSYGRGIEHNENISLLDVSATITAMAEGPQLPKVDGISLLPVLEGSEKLAENRSIISQVGTYAGKLDKPSAMVKKGNYKLVEYYGFDYPQLFDVEIDPLEIHNLALDDKYSDILKEMKTTLDSCWDGKYVLDFCDKSAENFAVLKNWSNSTHFPMPKRWEVNKEVNEVIGV